MSHDAAPHHDPHHLNMVDCYPYMTASLHSTLAIVYIHVWLQLSMIQVITPSIHVIPTRVAKIHSLKIVPWISNLGHST